MLCNNLSLNSKQLRLVIAVNLSHAHYSIILYYIISFICNVSSLSIFEMFEYCNSESAHMV